MIVYRDRQRSIATAEAVARVRAAEDPVECLIEFGELEAGVADALCPEADADLPALRELRAGRIPPGVPPRITVSVPEGFAYYGLFPDLYAGAARDFFLEAHPSRVVVIGIRSIGASLSTVVARALAGLGCEVDSFTVRPRGHPFDRRLVLAASLAERWRVLSGSHFVIVDEGPGLSGSSFACVAEAVLGLGVPEERIVFLPSWDPDPAQLRSETARRRWPRHRKYLRSFAMPGRDLSAGKWREFAGRCPAVQPQHERRKCLRGNLLYKFAGLGRYGRGALERARRLAEAGFGPTVAGLENGFLITEWVATDAPRPGIDRMAAYLACLRREFPAGRGEDLSAMIRVNTEEAIGIDPGPLVMPDGPAVAIDGRMLPHEWVGAIKTDGVDHHNDHFYPGPQDIAWDLAATEIEFGMPPEQAACLAARYAALSGDRDIARRVPFYRMAWLAFRAGYCDLAAGALGDSEDGARFAALRTRYAALLRREAGRHA